MIRRLLMCLGLVWMPLDTLAASATQSLAYLPIQDGGRVKPFDTFAEEALELIYGKSTFEGKPAYEIVMTWILQPQAWEDKKIFSVKNHTVKKALGLEKGVDLVTIQELLQNSQLPTLMQELVALRESKVKLDPYGQALQRLENQVFTFREIIAGRLLRVKPAEGTDTWRSLEELEPAEQEKFLEITKLFVAGLGKPAGGPEDAALTKAVWDWKEAARATWGLERFPSDLRVRAEVHYNHFHPFKWSWIAYLIAAVLVMLTWVLSYRGPLMAGAWVFTIIGLLLHTYGFALRSYLTERAPVTNMYETVVWVAWGAVVFAIGLELTYRWRVVLLAGHVVAVFSLILTDFAPTVLDSSLIPLEPVLRSNFWLTTHVMTITISYSAFFLAFALGNIGLAFFIIDEDKYKERIRAVTLGLYRSVQIGVAFLGPGIILGGVWADYSWGRFWGWDPKETWALIAFLGYLAILHGRIAGLLKEFGMCAAGIVTFSLVIMAWYGVNYVLGAGLHSYGFGAGGVEYVTGFVVLHIMYVVFAIVVRRTRLKSKQVS